MLEGFNSYHIGIVDDKIKSVTIKGYDSVSNLLDDILKVAS